MLLVITRFFFFLLMTRSLKFLPFSLADLMEVISLVVIAIEQKLFHLKPYLAFRASSSGLIFYPEGTGEVGLIVPF